MKRAAIIIGAALLPFVFFALVAIVSWLLGLDPGLVAFLSAIGLCFGGMAFLATDTDQ